MVHDLATVTPALPPLGEAPGPPVTTTVVGRLDSMSSPSCQITPAATRQAALLLICEDLVSSQGARVPEEGRGRAERRAEQWSEQSQQGLPAVAAFKDQRHVKSPELWQPQSLPKALHSTF